MDAQNLHAMDHTPRYVDSYRAVLAAANDRGRMVPWVWFAQFLTFRSKFNGRHRVPLF